MKKTSVLVFLLGLTLSFGCASRGGTKPTPAAIDAGSPPVATSESSGLGRYSNSNRLTLVLGGAGVASFATVGLLKKLQEEGFEIELIVATGLPALFSLAAGYLKSVHDVEWFATRLSEKDLQRVSSVDFRHEMDPSEALKGLILSSFGQTLLNQSRVPVVLAATNSDLGEPDVFSSGDWKEPLLRTLSVPGLYRKFPNDRPVSWVDSLLGLDAREAVRRGASNVVVVSMYDDFLSWSVDKSRKPDELPGRRAYAAQIQKTLNEAKRFSVLFGSISLKRLPLDFSAKRAAILAGYREGARLSKQLRDSANSTTN
jgi:predicted acylesterase/phospholipase RssA